MANPPPRAGLPKDKDDDSWGKLASDLLGIQFGGMADDDLDLPDEVVVSTPAKSHASEGLPPTTISAAVSAADARPVDEEPDLTFPEEDSADEDWEEDEESEEEDAVEVAPSRETPERDIWDLLENWDETSRESSRPHASDEPQRPSDRGDRRGGNRDNNRRDRSRDRGGDRPPRARESSVPAGDAPREGRGSRRDAPPRSPEPTERSTSRPDRSRSEQPPPAQSVVARESTSAPADDFASGLDAEPTPRSRPAAVRPAERSQSKPASSRAASPQPPRSKTADVDDFAGDLFVEPEPVLDEPTELESTESGAGEVNEDAASDDRRPRRRRRRRGGRGRRDETDVRRRDADEQPTGETESSDADEDDVDAAADSDESDVESTEEREETGRESRRPRRRRRRGHRRPEGAGVRQESDSDDDSNREVADEDSEEDASTAARSRVSDDEDLEEGSFEEESVDESEETVVAISYDDIPSWEEAISYLQRTRPRDSRSRNDGASRGRGGPNRR